LSPENAREGLKSLSNQSQLKVEIQNRLAIAVLAPNLEISLTDGEESDIKSLQFTPPEWIPQAWQEKNPRFLKEGIPSGEILQIELPIPLPANAAGYRVRVLYP
jgi:ribosomal protein L11 methyltransferase